ncbi:MAG: peptidoglycan bridge formation glycyltransferase FemA/FemB family protein [Candidatus Andersenbacteria bacterium]|nr:peptidoglycan bridge formation glycyltransferase FemA/FemB family protein [Candidatus Andersenbacteria bacterium]MCK4592149.1 peptidoglycan bridge formation glycyltransferase FemA/FemB family protein [Candidatus Parcubacteria bacterium]
MNIKEITNKSQWENFVQENKESTFLQSWNWGEFNRNTGEKIWRLGVFDNEELLAVALVIKVNARRGSFLFVPQGPIIKVFSIQYSVFSILNEFFDYLKDLGIKERVGFIRVSPILKNTEENLNIFEKAGFRNAPIHMMHPETTWLLDITKSEDEILKGMRKTHRNLIRRAAKEDVKIIQSTDEEYLKAFYDIHMETVRRHKFVPFPYDYIKSETDAFKNDDQISIFSAKYKGEIISSAIIIFYGEQAFYHHGSSSSKYYKIPSSYLNLWEAIKEAKKRGKKKFNFYGIVENKPKHPWAGLSKFKKGFGGHQEELLHCQDLPLNRKYAITWVVETIRKVRRGY